MISLWQSCHVLYINVESSSIYIHGCCTRFCAYTPKLKQLLCIQTFSLLFYLHCTCLSSFMDLQHLQPNLNKFGPLQELPLVDSLEALVQRNQHSDITKFSAFSSRPNSHALKEAKNTFEPLNAPFPNLVNQVAEMKNLLFKKTCSMAAWFHGLYSTKN